MKNKPPRKPMPHVAPQAAPQPITAAVPTAFLKEVDDAIQQEKLENLWRTWRLPLVGMLVAVLVGLAAWQGWGAWQAHQARTLAAEWQAASTTAEASVRKAALEKLVAHAGGGYRALAVFTLAADTLGSAGSTLEKAQAADALYAKVYTDRRQPSWLRELARYNAALALAGHNPTLAREHADILVPAFSTIGPVAGAGPVYPLALELQALLALQAGDTANARRFTQQLLVQPGLPADLSARARARLGALSTL